MADSGGKSFNNTENTTGGTAVDKLKEGWNQDYNCGFWKLVSVMSFLQTSFNSEKKPEKPVLPLLQDVRGGGDGGGGVEI